MAVLKSKKNDLRNVLLEETNSVAFVGSGVSTNYMTWVDFIEQLCGYASHKEGQSILREYRGSLDLDTLLHIAGKAKNNLNDGELRDFMSDTFRPRHSDQIPSMCKAIMNSPFNFVITTNYDTNLEDAFFELNGKPLSVVLPSSIYDVYRFIRSGEPFLLKIHGCARQGKDLVISYDDYLSVVHNNRSLRYVLSSIFAMHHILFLGYGHRDPHVTRYLEYERIVLSNGGMRRYSFVKKDYYAKILKARLSSLAVSCLEIDEWENVEIFLNQLVFARSFDRPKKVKNNNRQEYVNFLQNPRKELVWGTLMYAYTGSEIRDGDEVKYINKIIEDNKNVSSYIESIPSLNLIYNILKAQTFKRSNESDKATKSYAEIVELARSNNEILAPLRAMALRYAGMYWLNPPSPHSSSIKNLAYAEELFDEALRFLEPEFVREKLHIEKWKAILNGDRGHREESVTKLLEVAKKNLGLGLKKSAAWCQYAAVNQIYKGDLLGSYGANKTLELLDSSYWLFADCDHLFGIGTVYLLRAKVMFELGGLDSMKCSEIEDCIDQAIARAIITRDKRLQDEGQLFKSQYEESIMKK